MVSSGLKLIEQNFIRHTADNTTASYTASKIHCIMSKVH